jgi:hypothetical protein
MKTWFLCKVKYQKEDENGALKNVTEAYLLDAVSFTEAEARIYEKLGSTIRGEFYVTSISKSNIVDVFYFEDADIWHKCKITYYVAEESGKEKKITNFMLVTAHDVKQAYDRMYESLHNMLVSFKVPEIVETQIVEVFPYDSVEEDLNQAIPENLRPLSEVTEG